MRCYHALNPPSGGGKWRVKAREDSIPWFYRDMSMRRLLFALLCSVLAGGNAAYAASLFTSAEVTGAVMIYDVGTVEVNESDTHSEPAANRDSALFSLAAAESGFAGARSSAGLGWLRSASHTEAQTGANASSNYSARGASGWADTLTITTTDPLLQNTAGSFRAQVRTNGGLLVNTGFAGAALASALVQLEYADLSGAPVVVHKSQDMVYRGGPVFSGDASMDITADIPFMWNQPFTLSVALSASSSAAGFEGLTGSSGTASADYGNTSEWNGILGVFDANGATVSAFGLVSGSGVDYRLPISAPPVAVPVPPAAILFLSGILALLRRKAG